MLYGRSRICIALVGRFMDNNNRNWKGLRSFHKKTVRHITGQHIQKHRDGFWTYPDHEELERKYRLFSVSTYIQRRRGTPRKYMETYREDLLQKTMKIKRRSTDANKIL